MFGIVQKVFRKVFPTKHERDIRKLKPIVEKINQIYETLHNLSNDELRAKTFEFRQKIQQRTRHVTEEIHQLRKHLEEHPDMPVEEMEKIYKRIESLEKQEKKILDQVLNEILPEAFAVVKETARRFKEYDELVVTATDHDRELATRKEYIRIEGDKAIYKTEWTAAGIPIKWDMVHYDVQLMGGIVLHQGKIAEMATGEGKTLVATLPLYLNALAGKGVHLVTVNDFLARRDAEWMGPIYEFLGLTVDVINIHPPSSPERRKAYRADITYGTASEFGFDYLRDNMARTPEEVVQRELYYAIVDEIDSILIDDARTPLIISGPTGKTDDIEQYYKLKPLVEKLVDAQKQLAHQLVRIAREALQKGDKETAGKALLRLKRGLPKHKPFMKLLQEPGVQTLLYETENFYLQDNARRMPEIDEELYFVIDERHHSVELTDRGIELIAQSGQDPNMFVLPDIGERLADIEQNSSLSPAEKQKKKEELFREYSQKAQRLHILQQLLRAYTLYERDVDYVIMDGKVKIVDENTGRILEGRRYSEGLHQAIEAKENVRVEADTQTYATITLQNYFRMYYKLAGMTGTAETEATEFWEIYKLDVVVIPTHKPCIRQDLEDVVFKTKREKYNAIIEEIVRLHKQGRPVLVGTTSVEVSELLSRMLKRRGIPHHVLNAKHHQKEAEIIARAGQKGAVTIATNMAGRGTDIKLGPGVAELGGLAVIGTEHHEARRIDRQLRGRAGRQGDPGTSQFFVSLEDDLMRLFGSERLAKLLDKLGYQEGEPLQHPWITRAIERAQKKVEENHFGIRKRLLEYDNVMNVQREAIYARRRHALFGERLTIDIHNTIRDVIHDVVSRAMDADEPYATLTTELLRLFMTQPPFSEEEFEKLKPEEIEERIYQKVTEVYRRRQERMIQEAFPVIQRLYEERGDQIKKVVVPFSDGFRTIHGIMDLEKAYHTQGRELFHAFERAVVLSLIDEHWMNHLREMDYLRQAVQSAVYEQKDPLLVYKFEAFKLFEEMIRRLNRDIVTFLFRGFIPQEVPPQGPPPEEVIRRRRHQQQQIRTGRGQEPVLAEASPVPSPAAGTPAQARRGSLRGHPPVPGRIPVPGGTGPVAPIRRKGPRIGRNDPCPCGSGKKYKHCHGKFAS